MNEKPEALRLAEELDAYHTAAHHKEAAAELRRLHAENERLNAVALQAQNAAIDLAKQNERLREALDRSLTDEQIRQIAASIDRSMPLESAKILFARRIEAALRREDV